MILKFNSVDVWPRLSLLVTYCVLMVVCTDSRKACYIVLAISALCSHEENLITFV